MLRFLAIQNLAVIEAVEIEFDAGLSVLTGETGAGKSILVEAVGLLLGGRASPDLVRTGEECATVQAVFDGEDDGELLVRREVTAQGRSRAFVNGSLVTAGALRELGARLVDLHGQHEHQALLDPETHLDLLDRFAGLDAGRAAVSRTPSDLERPRRALAWSEVRELSRQRASRTRADRVPAGGTRQGPAADGRRRGTGGAAHAAVERRARAAASPTRATQSSTTATTRSLAGLGQVWRRVGELATLDPRFAPFRGA